MTASLLAHDEVEHAAEVVAEVIRSANATTELEVVRVGQCIESILAEARSHTAEIKDALGSLDGAGNRANITQAVRSQSRTVADFSRDVSREIEEQMAVALTALRQTENIAKAATTINGISQASKILALNTKIEAGRMGERGHTFAVIAMEMKRLSDVVEQTSHNVGEFAEQLMNMLPQIAEQSRRMRARSDDFSGRLQEQNEEVERCGVLLREAVTHSLGSGDRRLEQILQQAYEALSHLQFQDPVAQKLARIEALMKELVDTSRGSSVGAGRLCTKLSAEGQSKSDAPDSGDVLLF